MILSIEVFQFIAFSKESKYKTVVAFIDIILRAKGQFLITLELECSNSFTSVKS